MIYILEQTNEKSNLTGKGNLYRKAFLSFDCPIYLILL